MTTRVAGHYFNAIRPGEYCTENCTGIRSLVELCSGLDCYKVGDYNVAHAGTLNATEIEEIRKAASELREHMEKVFSRS